MTRWLVAVSLLAGGVKAKFSRRREPDRLLTLPPIDRGTWDPWPEFYRDTAKAAGDRAYLATAEFQRTCTCHGDGPRHAAKEDIPRVRPGWLAVSVTDAWPHIVAQLEGAA